VEPSETQFAIDLLRLTGRCRGIDKYVSSTVGLSVDEMHCISAVYADHPRSVSRLSELIAVSTTRASKILKSLEQGSLVTRELDPSDHRREKVILTDSGMKTVERIISLCTEVGSELFGDHHRRLATDLSWLSQAGASTP